MSLTLININEMRMLILLFLVVAMIGCTQKKASERQARKHIAQIEALIVSDSTRGEDFLSFFEQFRKDTLFQQERVCLPFKQIRTVDDNGAGVTRDSVIIGNNKKDWPFCSFLINDSISYSHQDLIVKKDTVELALSMDQSSFDSRDTHAIFIREKGKWFSISLRIISYSLK